jgi:hypothetical protein
MIMKSNRPTGIFLLIVPIVIFVIYIGIIVSVFIWIGYTMISTSNPNEITDDNI